MDADKTSTPLSRLRLFVQWAMEQGLCSTLYDFETQCGLSHRYISNSTANGKGNVGAEMLGKVARRFPMLNLVWVCTGDGDMLNKNSKKWSEKYRHIIEDAKRKYQINQDFRIAYLQAQKQIEILNKIIGYNKSNGEDTNKDF